MKIACIGWGSLIWNPKNLLNAGTWFNDGPKLPVEYLRQSANGRITLVIHPDATPVTTYWTLMATNDIPAARESLRSREGISFARANQYIGTIQKGREYRDNIEQGIADWMNERTIDATIWTRLPPKFDGINGKVATVTEVIGYLQKLEGEGRQNAEEYIRKTPGQIKTTYRAAIEKALGWTPASH